MCIFCKYKSTSCPRMTAANKEFLDNLTDNSFGIETYEKINQNQLDSSSANAFSKINLQSDHCIYRIKLKSEQSIVLNVYFDMKGGYVLLNDFEETGSEKHFETLSSLLQSFQCFRQHQMTLLFSKLS